MIGYEKFDWLLDEIVNSSFKHRIASSIPDYGFLRTMQIQRPDPNIFISNYIDKVYDDAVLDKRILSKWMVPFAINEALMR